MIQLGLSLKYKVVLAFKNQSVQLSILTEKPYHHLNKYRNTDSEKALDKIQYPFAIKLNPLGTLGRD